MISLTPIECRILGTLVEKAHTTSSAQYPLSLNSLTTGCNQISNRDPHTHYSEDQVLDAVEALQGRGMVIATSAAASRVYKYKHNLREAWGVSTGELVLLAELLMRGPQTLGELRTRASRMHALESLEVVRNLLDALMEREEPLVRRVEPSPGSRAERYAQLLCPDLHPLESSAPARAPDAPPVSASPEASTRIDALEARIERLTRAVAQLASALGESVDLDE